MEDSFLTQTLIDCIIDRYESDEILEILGIDAEDLCRILEDKILDSIEKFDVPLYGGNDSEQPIRPIEEVFEEGC